MIKNKMARFVSSAMAAALMFSAMSPAIEASAKEINTGEKTAATQEYNQQLAYAIEEMRIAIDIMDNKNLIDRDNYDRMVIFANTAVERIKDMDPENEYVKDINRLAGEISTLDSTILRRLMTDADGVKNATEDTKQDWINALNESITYGRQNNLLNYETAFAATEVLHTAAGIK